jgi:hypothetical protein
VSDREGGVCLALVLLSCRSRKGNFQKKMNDLAVSGRI